MKRLWAPWRMEYILKNSKKKEGDKSCIFCNGVPSREDDEKSFILYKGDNSSVRLNIYPYTSGHLLVYPKRHTALLEDLPEDELRDLSFTLSRSVAILKRALNPEGFNIGMNLGKIAGAGILDHLHWHIVPRWVGDTNFMPSIGDTMVMPEHLKETFKRLSAYFYEF